MKSLSILLVFLLFMINDSVSQVVVYQDSFQTSQGSTWTQSGFIGSTGWQVQSLSRYAAQIHNGILFQTNAKDFIQGGTGWVFSYLNLNNSFNSSFNPVLTNNTGIVTWTFNLRFSRSSPAGFSNNNGYGTAFILGCTDSLPKNAGDGYAVSIGNSGSPDQVRLVKFTSGIQGSGNATTLITGTFDASTKYVSVKVTYDPATDDWTLYARDDGSSSFADPLSGTLTLQGNATDATHTSATMVYSGVYTQGGNSVEETVRFDNLKITSATATLAEIEVFGNGNSILNNSVLPNATNATLFDTTLISCGTDTVIYTIKNTGSIALNLTGSPKVEISGTHASEFIVYQQPSSSVNPNDSTHFTIVFSPTGTGNRNATISIANDDSNENPFQFSLSGYGATGVVSPQTTLAAWTFDDQNNIADIADASNTAQIISLVGPGAITYSGTQGSPAPSARNSGATGFESGNGTKYWEIEVNTTNYNTLTLSSVQRSSSTGPRDFKVQYKTSAAATVYTDVPGSTIICADNYTTGKLTDIALPAGCENQPTLFLRWVMTSNTAAGGGSVAAAGGNNIDNIYIKGFIGQNIYGLHFRSKRSGDFSDPCTWQSSSDSISWSDAFSAPNYLGESITIMPNDTVYVNQADTADQITIRSNGILVLNNFDFRIWNSSGIDLLVDGTLQDDANAGNGISFENNATWQLGPGATYIKTSNSSASVYRDNYENGIATIPATANWIIRKKTSGNPTIVSVGGMYYPNLFIENQSGSAWSAPFASCFQGSSDYPRIKGNLEIGSNSPDSIYYSVYNNNAAIIPVSGNVKIYSNATLTLGLPSSGEGARGLGISDSLLVYGNLNYTVDSANTTNRKIEFTGSTHQIIAGSGSIQIANLILNKTGGTLRTLTSFTCDSSLIFNSSTLFALGNNTITSLRQPTNYGASAYFITDSVGFLKLIGSDSLVFPIGKQANGYTPATVYPGALDTVAARVFEAVYANGLSGTLLTGNTLDQSWHITHSNATPYNLKVQWNSTEMIGSLNSFLSRAVLASNATTGTSTNWDDWTVITSPAGASGSNPFSISSTIATQDKTFTVVDGCELSSPETTTIFHQ